MQEAHELFGVSKHALQRLVATGMVDIRRADAEQSPVLMNGDEIAPLAALHKDAMDETEPRRPPSGVDRELHDSLTVASSTGLESQQNPCRTARPSIAPHP
ncbi:hypothetical protein J2R76_003688 [Bradyrhizobium sp. USDA 4532]|uniref:hypothetical protein n=1 Tax=unclassified Bradyrhizobium TaxID=2631580 RepID=UPI0020A0C675|nr:MULTISPECIES: hypothetical protein [unclassified Bradyrhizobium]MCP1835351.1 hypothetical protein [Bradyrhizobium sp. USDA 4545]MCP1920097.1 hypothetical protein [Bradyrhizobium sp. USDA 4532]